MQNYYYPPGMVPNEKSSLYGGGMPPGAGLYQQQGAMAGARPTLPAGYQQIGSATSPGYPTSSGAPYGSGLGLAGPSPYAGAGLYQPSGTIAMGQPPAGTVAMPQPGLVSSQSPASAASNPYLARSTQPAGYPGQGQAMASTMSSSLYGGYPTYSSAGMPQQAGMPSQHVARVHAYPGPPLNAQVPPQLSAYPQMGQVPAGPPLGPSVAYPYGRQLP